MECRLAGKSDAGVFLLFVESAQYLTAQAIDDNAAHPSKPKFTPEGLSNIPR